jgi:PIN domain nuclease of toxin-antitoxin system
MSRQVIADTHAAVWYLTDPGLLSPDAKASSDDADEATGAIFISTITLIETRYLVEKGKLPPDVLTAMEAALDDPASAFVVADIDRAVANSLANIPRAIVPDMPDRIIAATALALDLPLVTEDTNIRALTSIVTVW